MKKSQKYLAGVVAAGFVVAASAAPSHAAFKSNGTQTLTAKAITGGAQVIQIASVAIKNRSDNAIVSAINWTGGAPGAGWLVADQYVDMVSSITTTSGGIQTYTDNTHASPAYTGVISNVTQTPAGLVSNSDTTQKIPTAWRPSTFTLAGVNPINPNGGAGESFLWFFHEDSAQVANNQGATDFANADPFITMYAAPNTVLTGQTQPVSGLHFAQGPTQFGGFQSVAHTFIYTEADFTGALAGTTYSTNKLILEAFSL